MHALAAVSPNKLRQRQLSALFEALSDWAKYAHLEPASEAGNFIVDLGRDEAPIYAPAFPAPLTELCRSIATDELVSRIEQTIDLYDLTDADQVGGRLYLPSGVSRELLVHAGGSWGRRSSTVRACASTGTRLAISSTTRRIGAVDSRARRFG